MQGHVYILSIILKCPMDTLSGTSPQLLHSSLLAFVLNNPFSKSRIFQSSHSHRPIARFVVPVCLSQNPLFMSHSAVQSWLSTYFDRAKEQGTTETPFYFLHIVSSLWCAQKSDAFIMIRNFIETEFSQSIVSTILSQSYTIPQNRMLSIKKFPKNLS